MRLLDRKHLSRLAILVLLVALPTLLAACENLVSDGNLEAVKEGLRTAEEQVQALQTQLQEGRAAQARARARVQELEAQLQEGQAAQAQAQVQEGQAAQAQARVQELETQLQTVTGQVGDLEAQVQDLQGQVQQGATAQAQLADEQAQLGVAAAIMEVLDAFEEGPDGEGADEALTIEYITEFVALIEASGDEQLLGAFVALIDSALASADPPSQDAVHDVTATIVAAGDPQLEKEWQEFVAALDAGHPGSEFLDLAAAVLASDDPVVKGALGGFFEHALEEGEPSEEVVFEFFPLLQAPGNEEVAQAFFALGGGPPEEFFEDIGEKIGAIGDPTLDALFEAAQGSPGPRAFEALFEGLAAVLREAIPPEVQQAAEALRRLEEDFLFEEGRPAQLRERRLGGGDEEERVRPDESEAVGEHPSAGDILGFTALVVASGDEGLEAKWEQVIVSILASAGPPPQELLSQAAAALLASGDIEIGQRFREVVEGAARGDLEAPFLELLALVQSSGDSDLEGLLEDLLDFALEEGKPSDELFSEFVALIAASGNEEILDAFRHL